MQKITTHSKSGLFLMEMIFVLLFLGLTCGVCVRLFAASYSDRTRAREYNHIQELTTSVGEILEGTSGTADGFYSLCQTEPLWTIQLNMVLIKTGRLQSFQMQFT